MDLKDLLAKSLVAQDDSRDRSQQVEIGVSSIGGCKRQAWHIINQTPKTNFDTERLAAIMGTAIHAAIADAIKIADPFGDDLLIEEPVMAEGLKGHVDLYIKSQNKVVDWKTVTLAKLDKFPTSQQKTQVNVYAYLLEKNGYTPQRVSVVGIPRDGKMGDVKVWEADYDKKIVIKGLAWLDDVKSRETPPDPERRVSYCALYCSYYDPSGEIGCQGIN